MNHRIMKLLPKLVAASTTTSSAPKKHFLVAGFLSIIPGLGHIYLGQWKKGIIILVLSYPPFFILTIPFGVFDAIVLARRTQQGKSIGEWECFWNRPPRETADLWEITSITKDGRSEEMIGTEERSINNSASSTRLLRKLKIHKEWSHSFSIEHEKANSTTDTTTIQIKDGITRQKSIEEMFRNKSGYSFESKHIYEEDIEVEIPPFKIVRVYLTWKNIIDVGTICLRNQHGIEINVPFSTIVGITFDQAQVEE